MAPSEMKKGALLFEDFLPKDPAPTADTDDVEVFDDLVDRANLWLESRHEIKVVFCETMIVYGRKDSLLTNIQRAKFSLSTKDENHGRLEGWAALVLRVWYKQRQSHDTEPTQFLGFVNVAPRTWTERSDVKKHFCESLKTASDNFNNFLTSGNFVIGKVLNVNTCHFWMDDSSSVSPDPNQIYQDLSIAASQVEFMRIFYEVGHPGPKNVRYMDFLPTCKKTQAFDLWEEFLNDLQGKRDIKLLNVETVTSIVDDIQKDGSYPAKELPYSASNISDVIYFIRAHYTVPSDVGSDYPPQPNSDQLFSSTLVPKVRSSEGSGSPEYENVTEALSRLSPEAANAVDENRLVGINTIPIPMSDRPQSNDEQTYCSFVKGEWLKTVRLCWRQ